MTTTRQKVALLGDCMMARPISVYREPQFLKIREILSQADVVFANFEANAHRYLDDPFAQRFGGGTYVTTEPHLLSEFKWLGVNMVACGSSHADDYGRKGILDTMRYLDDAGIAHAGSGRHLAEARAPAFLETHAGRVALLATTAQFKEGGTAGDQRYDSAGCPGVNAFRHKTIYKVDRDTLQQLREVGKKIGWEAEVERRRFQGDAGHGKGDEKTYSLLGKTFVLGEPAITTVPNKRDMEENLRQVRYARQVSDRVVVSFHGHDLGGPTLMTAKRRTEVDDLADFAIEYGRRAIDAGADIFVAHGPQVPLAVEIYKGKPMLHGVGAFVFQVEFMRYLPAEVYERYELGERATPGDFMEHRYAGGTRGHAGDPLQWEQVFAVCDFEGKDFAGLKLYPIDLGHSRGGSQRGRPMMAEGETATRILKRVQRLSAKYGCEVAIRDGVGVIAAK